MPESLNSIEEVKVAVTKGELVPNNESAMSTVATVTADGLISETVKSEVLSLFATPELLIAQKLNDTSVRVTALPDDTARLISVVQKVFSFPVLRIGANIFCVKVMLFHNDSATPLLRETMSPGLATPLVIQVRLVAVVLLAVNVRPSKLVEAMIAALAEIAPSENAAMAATALEIS